MDKENDAIEEELRVKEELEKLCKQADEQIRKIESLLLNSRAHSREGGLV